MFAYGSASAAPMDGDDEERAVRKARARRAAPDEEAQKLVHDDFVRSSAQKPCQC